MSNAPAPAHWIRPNHVTRVPRRHVIVDTEAVEVDDGRQRSQTFRLACAAFDHQTKAGRDWRPTERARFTSTADLWAWVDSCTMPKRRTVVVAHNLAYDLRVGRAFTDLPALGWSLEMVRLDGGSAWCQWRRDNRSLCMVDTVSWFGVSLDRIGGLLRMTKPPLPAAGADLDTWFERCEADVEILRCAWRRVLDWIDTGDLGNFKPTGAGQGWAFLRHRHLTHKVLHHGNQSVANLERHAAHTGRCEAWLHGRLPASTWTEWDFTAAYAQVAEESDVPVRLQTHLGPKGAQIAADGLDGAAAMIRCNVETDVPTVPLRRNGGILWPTGRFTTWLWDIEARQAQAAGSKITAVEGWRYQTAPALRQWASWVLDRLADDPERFDPLLRLIVKGWSRTTVGRFGAQWASWEDFGAAMGDDCSLRQAVDGDDGRRFRMMMVGGRCLAEGDRTDAPDGAIHVMSWIMAACRVRLWRAMEVAGFDNLAYVDTDGVLVNVEGSKRLRAAKLPGLRPKSRWRSVEVLGPRQLILRGELRAAGVPKSAVRVGPRRWNADVWRSLPASLRNGELDRVVLRDRTFTITGVDSRRLHLPGGRTAPVELDEI